MKKIIFALLSALVFLYTTTTPTLSYAISLSFKFSVRPDSNPGALMSVMINNTIAGHKYSIVVQDGSSKNVSSGCTTIGVPGFITATDTSTEVAWGCLPPGSYRVLVGDVDGTASINVPVPVPDLSGGSGPSSGGGAYGGGSQPLYCAADEIKTAIGCIPTQKEGFAKFFLGYLLGIGGLVAFFLILYAGFQILTSKGNPEKIEGAKQLLTAALAGAFFIIFSAVILQLMNVDILGNLPGFPGFTR